MNVLGGSRPPPRSSFPPTGFRLMRSRVLERTGRIADVRSLACRRRYARIDLDAQTTDEAGQHDERASLVTPELRALHTATGNNQLLAQQRILGDELRARPNASDDHAEHAAIETDRCLIFKTGHRGNPERSWGGPEM
jgi:hypothetical protein